MNKLIKLSTMLMLLLAATITAQAQTTSNDAPGTPIPSVEEKIAQPVAAVVSAAADQVCISQETANAAARAFDDVKALRDAVEQLEKARKVDEATVLAMTKLIDKYEVLANKDAIEKIALRDFIFNVLLEMLKKPRVKKFCFICG